MLARKHEANHSPSLVEEDLTVQLRVAIQHARAHVLVKDANDERRQNGEDDVVEAVRLRRKLSQSFRAKGRAVERDVLTRASMIQSRLDLKRSFETSTRRASCRA